ncbi:MAG: manganese efflux pump MntP family protein [Clostridiales bacterium]|nr:manganese efflux pump MntP family protein [Clostridiales bacterium]
MGMWELIVVSISIAMDAFAVAICKGLAMKKSTLKNAVIVGLWFGAFQCFMPLVGFAIGSLFSANISAYDHWVAFILLVIIGIEMISNALSPKQTEEDSSLSIKTMATLALATSIDALAVGVGFAFLKINIYIAVLTTGVVSFALSAVGVKIGSHFGIKHKKKAELMGGIALILIAIKIVLEHLGIINF